MGGDDRFWLLFGGIWLAVGICFVAASVGVNLFADPAMVNEEAPLWLFFTVGLVASAAGWFIIHRAYTAAARDRRLKQSGIDVTATVTDLRRSLIDINREVRWHVVYRYDYNAGRAFEGKSRALRSEAVQGFRPGDRVRIKVDPQKPEESLFLGAA